MKAEDLYARLEADFVRPGITDNWYRYMTALDAYLCDNFRACSIGLVCDFARELGRAYTAVFPSDGVLERMLDDGAQDAVLFLHHPSAWDLEKAPKGFYQMNPCLLDQLQERRVAVYCLHHPLDNYGEYSTSKTLADALGLSAIEAFAEFGGALSAVVATGGPPSVAALRARFAAVLGHEARLYPYGDDAIREGKVAICAGGGNEPLVLEGMAERGINVLITGITRRNDRSQAVHDQAERHGISLLGGTHYSTERFACEAMCGYFEGLGLPATFIGDRPCLLDL